MFKRSLNIVTFLCKIAPNQAKLTHVDNILYAKIFNVCEYTY